jgi:serine/threonine protein kinase
MRYKAPNANESVLVAVKVMPARWVTRSPQEFSKTYPNSNEQPWLDFATVSLLNKHEAPFCCKLFGVFCDAETCYVVHSLANMGDLFGYCERLPAPGQAREAQLRPILFQVFSAVRQLHDIGLAHGDLSLESFVLNDENGDIRVKLIDYGMATLKRFCTSEVRGKLSYQAPEMHRRAAYDVFLTDAFATGVIVYASTKDHYPWKGHGFAKMVEQRTLRKPRGERLVEVMSEELIGLIAGLVDANVSERLCLGEACFRSTGRLSVSSSLWLAKGSDRDRPGAKKDRSGRFGWSSCSSR